MRFAGTSGNDGAVEANSVERAVGELEKKFKLKLEKRDLHTKHEVKNCKHYGTCNAVNINRPYNGKYIYRRWNLRGGVPAILTITYPISFLSSRIVYVLLSMRVRLSVVLLPWFDICRLERCAWPMGKTLKLYCPFKFDQSSVRVPNVAFILKLKTCSLRFPPLCVPTVCHPTRRSLNSIIFFPPPPIVLVGKRRGRTLRLAVGFGTGKI